MVKLKKSYLLEYRKLLLEALSSSLKVYAITKDKNLLEIGKYFGESSVNIKKILKKYE